MSAPRQPDLFAALTREVVAELESEIFTGEGCVPDPDWVAPDFLRLPTDDVGWMPAPASAVKSK